jgi:tetratricopeptide (TPR) repeat protein/cell division protein FtsN
MQTLIDEVIQELENKNFSEAIKHCNQLIASFPENYILYEIRGNCYFETANFSDAINNYEEALNKIDKSNEKQKIKISILYNRIGFAKIKLNDLNNAIKNFKEAEKFRSNFPELQNNFANAYRKLGNYELAIEYCNKAIELKPDFPEVYNNRGNIYYLMSKDNEAIKDYTKAIELNPKYAGAYYNRGTVYFYSENNPEGAKNDWEKAIELNPDYGIELNEKIRGITESLKIFSEDSDDMSQSDTTEFSDIQSDEKQLDKEMTEEIDENEYQSIKDLTDFYYSDSFTTDFNFDSKEDTPIDDLLKIFEQEKIDDKDEPVLFDLPELPPVEDIKEIEESGTDSFFDNPVEKSFDEKSDLLKDMDDYFKTFEPSKKDESDIVIPEFNFKDVFNNNKDEEVQEINVDIDEVDLDGKSIFPEELKNLHNYISSAPDSKDNAGVGDKTKTVSPIISSPAELLSQKEQILMTSDRREKSTGKKIKEGKKSTVPIYVLIFILLLVIVVGFIFIYQKFIRNDISVSSDIVKIDSTQLSKNKDTIASEETMPVNPGNIAESNDSVKQDISDESNSEQKTEQVPKEEVKETQNLVTSVIEGRKDLILLKDGGKFFLQLGSFKEKGSAERKSKILSERGIKSIIKEIDLGEKGKFYRLLVGEFDSRESAISFADKIEKE